MIRPQMTGQQAEALATFLVSLRPGQRRWTKTACLDALTNAATQHTNDTETIARAAIRAALTPKIVGPDVIPMPGAHWETTNEPPPNEPNRARRCQHCTGIHTPNAPHDPPRIDRPTNLTHHVEAAKLAVNGKKPNTHTKETTP